MSLSRENQARIQRAIDGCLPPAELDALKRDVIASSDLRAAYVDRVWLDASLRADRESLRTLVSEPVLAERAAPRWPWLVAVGAFAAAACLAVVFAVKTKRTELRLRPVALLVQAQNAKWAGSTLPTLEQSKLGRGTLALVEGIVTLRFDSGATVTMEAPSKLEVIGAMRCRLIEGSVTAEVPPAAHGFTIDTPDLSVRDLGTRFGVTAGSAGNTHVFVFEGEVALSDPAGAELRRLTAGKNYRVSSGPATAHLEPRRFEPAAAIDGWTAITTGDGRGKDAYVRRGPWAAAGREPLLMVKHSDLARGERNERRTFVTFDLAELRGRPITEAELVLDPEPSGWGFSTMVPDSRFAVHGVIEETLDGWNESTLTWAAAAPASGEARPEEGRVRKLAEFWIPRGGSGTPLTIRGAALAEFLRADANGLATFIIVRETGESDPSGLVHAFASKEHPTARPPTLRVR